MTIDNFYGKKIVVIGGHQDDETLFCGGLLSEISNKSDINIICTSKPYPNRPDTLTRETALQNVCNYLGAKYIQLNFKDPGPQHYPEEDFIPTTQKIKSLLEEINPDIVITHNNVGEYGHIYHKFIHNVVLSVWKKTLIVFGVGLQDLDFEISFNTINKQRLFDFYLPQWNGPKMYSFAMLPESYKILNKWT
jgi:LmbE family N-acetylglucosaminyl deacetylase